MVQSEFPTKMIGAVVPDANALATQTDTNYTVKVVTGKAGEFQLPNLPVGPYKLTIQRPGFSTYEQTGIVLTVGQAANFQVELKIGSASEQVVVTSEAATVDSTQSAIQDTIGKDAVAGLPLNGCDPAALVYTVAGVTDSTLNVPANSGNSAIKEQDSSLPSASAPSSHGVPPGGVYFSLDGAGNVDPFTVIGGPFPNPDATQEFSVVTGTYGARYVSAPGGAVNIVTRSGTNQFHGTVFEFIRNVFFNARNYFATEPDALKRNQFGFAVGGPIKTNRLFFFGSYQASKISDSTPYLYPTPTQAERSGNFSKVCGQAIRPARRELRYPYLFPLFWKAWWREICSIIFPCLLLMPIFTYRSHRERASRNILRSLIGTLEDTAFLRGTSAITTMPTPSPIQMTISFLPQQA